MLIFLICLISLVAGYYFYGNYVEKVFSPDSNRKTPAITVNDGVDYMAMPTWKVFLIQLLDIAGIGPIFGPVLGALYGPQALLWIVLGTIFGGAVHDYFSGMISVRQNGDSIPDVVGQNMGNAARNLMRVFSLILLTLVGVVFVLAPSKLLSGMTGMNTMIFVLIIFAYYFIATILPIDKIIGKLYPLFGLMLLFMTLGVAVGLVVNGYEILPNRDFSSATHPTDLPLWPLLFVTLSCGAISGFHCTQSPLMARCMKNENNGKKVFFGSMIMEGVIALIWCTAGMSFYKDPAALQAVIAEGSPAAVVNELCTGLLGPIGGFAALLGVIALPITSGDTAFRSSRLILAESIKMDQDKAKQRLMISIPLFLIGGFIATLEFGLIWRYFGWANQTLAMIMLWTASVYLIVRKKNHWITSLPATFMTAVIVTYILQAGIGFGLTPKASGIAGVIISVICLALFISKYRNKENPEEVSEVELDSAAES
jgi:carbon starvation protein CstA